MYFYVVIIIGRGKAELQSGWFSVHQKCLRTAVTQTLGVGWKRNNSLLLD